MNRTAAVVFVLALIVGYNLYDDFDPGIMEGKRVLVTGASTGIGEQMAYHYARLGAKVLITARREERLIEVTKKCRKVGSTDGEYHYVTADMGKLEDTKKVIDTAESALGGLDFLVLNHIMATPLGPWHGTPGNLTLVDRIMDTNFKAYIHLTSHSMAMLEESRGSVIVVSSVAGRLSQPFILPYSASKFALDGFFSGLRQEYKARNVDVSVTICIIGLIGTENAVANLRNYGFDFLLDTLPLADPADAAMAIIRGGALRVREVFFPYMEARMSTILRDWIPNTLEALIRFLYSKS